MGMCFCLSFGVPPPPFIVLCSTFTRILIFIEQESSIPGVYWTPPDSVSAGVGGRLFVCLESRFFAALVAFVVLLFCGGVPHTGDEVPSSLL